MKSSIRSHSKHRWCAAVLALVLGFSSLPAVGAQAPPPISMKSPWPAVELPSKRTTG